MVIVGGNGPNDASSNPGQSCVSLCANTFEKDLNPHILLPALRKLDRLGSLILVWQLVKETENFEFIPVALHH